MTIHVVQTTPPICVIEFKPGGVLGEDVHEQDERLVVVRGLVCCRWTARGVERWEAPFDIRAGTPHSITAGRDGAIVVCMFDGGDE